MDPEKTAAESAAAPKQKHHNFDWLTSASFLGAGAIGLWSAANTIRDRFYYSFVRGYGHVRTPFTPLIEASDKQFQDINDRHIAGTIDAAAYKTELKGAAKDFRSKVVQKLRDVYHIETTGIEGVTTGLSKQWEMLGIHAKIDATLSFATIATIGIGAISLLRHTKQSLDHIDDRLDKLDSQAAGR